jgi:hypothetical protein
LYLEEKLKKLMHPSHLGIVKLNINTKTGFGIEKPRSASFRYPEKDYS